MPLKSTTLEFKEDSILARTDQSDLKLFAKSKIWTSQITLFSIIIKFVFIPVVIVPS